MRLTVRDIMSLRLYGEPPCWTRDKVRRGFGRRKSLLPSEIVFGLHARRRRGGGLLDADWFLEALTRSVSPGAWSAYFEADCTAWSVNDQWSVILGAALWLDEQPHWRKGRR